MGCAHRSLLELLRQLVKSGSVEEFFQRALPGALGLIPDADAGSIVVRGPEGYRYTAVAGFDLSVLRAIRFSPERVFAWYGGTRQQALQALPRAHRVAEHPSDLHPVESNLAGFHWTLVVPVPLGGEIEAILNLDRRSPEPFSAEALGLAEELGKSLEVVLRSLREQERARERLQREEVLSRVLASLASFKEAEALWASLPGLVAELMPVALAAALRREGEVMRVVGSLGPQPPVGYVLPKGEGMSWRAIEQRQVLFASLCDPRVHRLEVPDPERYHAAFVPLFDPEGGPLGALAFHGEQEFSPDDAALLSVLAQGVGNVLSKLEAQAAQAREVLRLEALAQATQALGPAHTAEEVYRRTVEEALRQTRAVSALLSRLNPADESLEVVAAAGYAAERAVGLRFYNGQGVAWEVYRNKAPLFIPDVSRVATSQFASGKRSAGSYLGVPLSDPEGQFIGVLSVDTAGQEGLAGPRRLTPEDRYVLEALAQVAGVAISRLSALRQAQRQADAYRALVQMSADLETLTDPAEVARRALETLLDLTGFEAGSLYRLEASEEHPKGYAHWRPVVQVGRYPEPHPGVAGSTPIWLRPQNVDRALEGGTVWIPDYQTWPYALREYKGSGIRSVLAARLSQGERVVGVLALGTFTRPHAVSQEHLALFEAVARRLERALERVAHLEEITRTREAALRSLGLGLELRDLETKGHTDRVVALSMALGERLGFADLEGLRLGAYLHDLGKLAVPDEVLQKAGELNTGEWRIMKTHPEIGYEMLQGLSFLPDTALNVVRYHHERWDGTGYPQGLRQQAIPLEARIFAVVDVYDALSHTRPYKTAWEPQAVRAELEAQAGKTLDPEVVRAFLSLLPAA
ncbi:Cyclic di-GMP phosphodiesterase response regulator RpfG [Calidithermus terrae]|uniref:Cyclic di-GMP phosphodiesterase response regulator RpfG n=1 Tax=Calidithermus terrae TaxID=1408545 RepID=A0A399F1Y4_9DEIN|nr:Cyclic di-GMP phosphodiesterase response regulator RpfG [Calidithermus terrae]